jgi:hypothetical protein
MRNDVCEIVPRLEGNSFVSSRWIYKIKQSGDGSIKKFKEMFWREGSPRKREWNTRSNFLQFTGMILFEILFIFL